MKKLFFLLGAISFLILGLAALSLAEDIKTTSTPGVEVMPGGGRIVVNPCQKESLPKADFSWQVLFIVIKLY